MAEVHAGPRQTSRLYDITGVTEGEMDLLIALLGSVRGDLVHSPRKYANRLLPKFRRAAGYREQDTDAYQLLSQTDRRIKFRPYSEHVLSNCPLPVPDTFVHLPDPAGGVLQVPPSPWNDGIPALLLPSDHVSEQARRRRRQGFWPWKR